VKVVHRRFTLRERIQLYLDCGAYWRFMGNRCIGPLPLQTLSRRKYRKVDRAIPLFPFQRR
jgi:hypothetical protein